MADLYLVWSHEHSGWWRKGGAGYTPHLSQAGHYTRAEALRIATMAIPGAEHALNELPVRLDDVTEMRDRYCLTYGERQHEWM
jgi:hypothetical protein